MQLAGAAIALTAGCSSVPVQTEAAKPPEAPRPGYATLHVGRPTGFNVSIFPITIDIDGKTVASLAPGRYITVELAPGKHVMEVPNNAWSRAINGIPHQVEFTTTAGKTYYALPTDWYSGSTQRVTMVGSAVVVDRVADHQTAFAVQEAAAPPAEFASLSHTPSP
ncbi:DUF2846 domain-containing protein [Bradyrhizobium ontarionense]|uniref:DUF2846 domain-containing protein n=1 Tax=Bradyrhizobium ontarionense TaxID=2898149 RepID=A0ABY3RAP4_9BRAD|nr:DUF2846 domain-containing protein [Bradyrhizobium sp. A19]UFZ03881.1 DUF2846 domain-containing protein [Bradyrhizobium sp. A19]